MTYLLKKCSGTFIALVTIRLIARNEMLHIKINNIQSERKAGGNMICRLHAPINHTAGYCHYCGTICLFIILFLIITVVPAKAVTNAVSYLYNLSNFNGPVLSQWANIYVDKGNRDIYVINPRKQDIRVFDENGMEVYIFGDDGSLGYVKDLTVDGHGNPIIISRMGLEPDIILLNYRGKQVSEIELTDLPDSFSKFRPDRVIYRDEKIYLAQTDRLLIVVADMNGVYQTGYDIASLLNIPSKKRDENIITGLTLDKNGNILFTISVLFQAFRLAPDGEIEAFGKSGGGPGTFGVIAGIASDDKGFIYIADRLRCVVMVFDNDLEFLTEFGYRGYRPGNLIVPDDIDVDSDGKIYVSQAGGRGVSVFSISHN